MTNRSRILIADDHTLVAELCKRLLETEHDAVGIVSYGRTLVHRWTRDSLTPEPNRRSNRNPCSTSSAWSYPSVFSSIANVV